MLCLHSFFFVQGKEVISIASSGRILWAINTRQLSVMGFTKKYAAQISISAPSLGCQFIEFFI